MENTSRSPTFDEYVKLSVESGVEPISLIFRPVLDCESGRPIAFRTQSVIYSVIAGTLNEEDYTHVCDKRETGIQLFRQSLKRVIYAIKEFSDCDPPIGFLSLRCPAEAVENPEVDLYGIVSEAIKSCRLSDPSMLCVEFPASLIEKQTKNARTALLDLQILKVKTMICGCGKEDFPISKLVSVSPYAVMLDSSATAWAGNRNKPQLVSAMVSYIKSMGVEVYAEGESSKRRDLRNTDCAGFIETGAAPLGLGQAVQIAKAAYDV